MFTKSQIAADLAATPELVTVDGRRCWRFPSGRLVLAVSGGDGDEDKKFTQADIDRIVTERLARAKAEPSADYEDLKRAKQELDELRNAGASETEKLQRRIAQLEADLTKANGERDAQTAAAQAAQEAAATALRRSAVVAEAAKQRALNADQVFALLPKDAVTIGNDGQVTGADEAVKKFLAENPHFVGKPARPTPDPGQGASGDAIPGSSGRAEAAKRFGNRAASNTERTTTS